MADKDDVRSFNQIKAYPRGNAQGGRAIQAVKGTMSENNGTSGHHTVMRETSEGRATARTRDGMPMVEVEIKNVELGVDHGVVDTLNVAPLHPDAYKSGKLWYTAYVAAHLAAYPEGSTDPERPIVDEITPPDSIKGKAPVEGSDAQSLKVNKTGSNREAVLAKKIMMGRCPASIFTGRTRLYAQALYGRHDELGLCSLDITLPSATPAILVGKSSQFRLSTNSGVYLDPATGNHWMIDVGFGSVSFYPMSASEDAIEDLRTYLIDPEFPAVDKERVETYILSDSTVDKSKIQTVSIPPTNGYSMGYGWHFNWDGDRCDIVINEVDAAPGGGSENVSTHYRLTFTKSPTNVWSATRAVVEGPVRWKSLRNVHPITEPTWDDMVLEKFGAHLGPLPYGNAPFYAFYARNALKVARYDAVTTDNVKQGITREPSYYDPGTFRSIGSDAINYRQRDAWTGTVVTLSCGGETVSYTSESYNEFVYTRTSPAPGDVWFKQRFGPTVGYLTGESTYNVGQPGSIPTNLIYDEYWGDILVYAGGGESGWSTTTIDYSGAGSVRGDYGMLYARASTESFTSASTKYAQFITVIPFYDSEAIYLYGQQDYTATETGVAQTDHAAWFAYDGVWETGAIDATHGVGSAPGGDGYAAEDVSPISRTVNSSSSTAKLICRAGTFSGVTFPAKSAFWSAADSVAQFYGTTSSAIGLSVKSIVTDVSSNNPAGTTSGNYVGWA